MSTRSKATYADFSSWKKRYPFSFLLAAYERHSRNKVQAQLTSPKGKALDDFPTRGVVFLGSLTKIKYAKGKYTDIMFDDILSEVKKDHKVVPVYMEEGVQLSPTANKKFPYVVWSSIKQTDFAKPRDLDTTAYRFLREHFERCLTILKQANPKAVLIQNESTQIARCMIYLCKKHHIPTFGFQHGIIDKQHPYYSNTYPHHDLVCPDTFFTFMEYESKHLQAEGPMSGSKTTFVPAGSNKLYKMLKARGTRQAALKKLKLKDQKYLFYCSNNQRPKQYAKHTRQTLEALKKFDDKYHIIISIRPHDEDPSIIRGLIEELNIQNCTVYENSPFFDLLTIADIVVSNYSTSVYDALLYDAKTVQVDMGSEFISSAVYNFGTPFASSTEELVQAILALSSTKKQKNTFTEEIKKHKEPAKFIANYITANLDAGVRP